MDLSLLVLGAGGQLGADLLRAAESAGVLAAGLTRAELDVTSVADVAGAVRAFASAGRDGERLVCVNAAAYTAVDAAETDQERAYAVNANAPGLIAAACAQHGVRLVHVSTDYVFPGDADRPYETDDPTGPTSVYGASKLAGEQAVLAGLPESWVVRTAWVYGETGANFVKTMLRLEGEKETLDVVADQRGAPTWSADLAAGLLELAGSDAPYGVHHLTNAGETTWHGLARAVFEEAGADPERVRPTTTDKFPRPAPRPAYSVLSTRAWTDAGLAPLQDWRAALHAAYPLISHTR